MAEQHQPSESTLAFNRWLREKGNDLGYYRLPPQHIDAVHAMLKRAFKAGVRHELRKQEPIQVGGVD